VFLIVLGVGGCDSLDDLLTVDQPDQINASDLDSPQAADLLVRSVTNEFRCTLTRYIAASSMTGTEWGLATNSAGLAVWEQRRHDTSGFGSQYASGECTGQAPALYRPIARTRWLADEVLRRLDGWTEEQVPSKVQFTAQVAAFAGYIHVLFGESFCNVTFDSGPEEPRTVAFERAVERFDRTIAAGAAASSSVLNLARVGKARALLNLGREAEAATVAADVPANFSYTLTYSNAENVTRNIQWSMNHRDQSVTVMASFRNMSFGGVADPRVAVRDTGVNGAGTNIRVWVADKYPAAGSPVRVASWEEAQLIVAEAALEDGRVQDAVDIINELHDKVNLPPFASQDAGETRDQLIYERSAALFMEGQHLYDITRLGLPLDPAEGTDMPFGGTYGAQLCFQLPAIEFQNNPNIGG
jgi:hypothetical protein